MNPVQLAYAHAQANGQDFYGSNSLYFNNPLLSLPQTPGLSGLPGSAPMQQPQADETVVEFLDAAASLAVPAYPLAKAAAQVLDSPKVPTGTKLVVIGLGIAWAVWASRREDN